MSKKNVDPTASGLEVSMIEQSNPAPPTWLAEALLLGHYWQRCGLLERLQQQIHMNRGRMGKYEVCDFVLLLLADARKITQRSWLTPKLHLNGVIFCLISSC